MDLTEFQNQALRTAWKQPNKTYSSKELLLVWNAMGVAGEAGEYSAALHRYLRGDCPQSDVIKELGDVCWYVVVSAHHFGTELGILELKQKHQLPSTLVEASTEGGYYAMKKLNAANNLTTVASVYVDRLKKAVFHDHNIEEHIFIADLLTIIEAVKICCTTLNITIEQCFYQCIKKLEERYPDGFSFEASQKQTTKK